MKPDPAVIQCIYDAYPKKVKKPQAVRAIERALKRHAASVILEGVNEMAAAMDAQGVTRKNSKLWHKVLHPATYFNNECYLDDVKDFPWYEADGTARHAAPQGKYDEFA
jgi:hypothetical protein